MVSGLAYILLGLSRFSQSFVIFAAGVALGVLAVLWGLRGCLQQASISASLLFIAAFLVLSSPFATTAAWLCILSGGVGILYGTVTLATIYRCKRKHEQSAHGSHATKAVPDGR